MKNFTIGLILIFVVIFSTSFVKNDPIKIAYVELCYTDTVIIHKPLENTIATIPKGIPLDLKNQEVNILVDFTKISSSFGQRLHPIFKIPKFHTGIDISAPRGTSVFSTSYGIVTKTGTYGSYGQLVVVQSGKYQTKFAHLSQIAVKEGDYVKEGDKLGEVGSTGLSTGNHLHYEVLYDKKVLNPKDFL